MGYFDTGALERTVSTASADAQRWFNRGLAWLYAYNHDESAACFEKAIAADPDCAMAHWGVALAVAPNYNRPWEYFPEELKISATERMTRAIAEARAAKGQTPVERALIEALATRCPASADLEDYCPLDDAYAAAMLNVHQSAPEDLDVAALAAEALITRTPWQLWDLTTGQPTEGSSTRDAQYLLEGMFTRHEAAWDHLGLLHMYIHLMEMSPTPEAALRHGDRLAEISADLGHLLHMSTHIDVLCGDYQNTVARNWVAVHADNAFRDLEGGRNFYTVYRLHDMHFVIYGAMLAAQPSQALRAAEMLQADLTPDVVSYLPIAFEAFYPMRMHVLIRFGMWQQILDDPFPEDRALYAVSTAVQYYARAVAAANLGQHDLATQERDAFYAARDAMPEDRMMMNNTCEDVLAVSEQMMLGEIAFKSGERETGLEHLRRCVTLCDALPYDEPWGFMQPPRHALGALLMEAGQFEEAEAVYRADLGLDSSLPRACHHPRNVWALHGLEECLRRRGETVEHLHIKAQLDQALARAAIPIKASCACRAVA